jgi:cytochrome bd ubiquinol oxidase subunit II
MEPTALQITWFLLYFVLIAGYAVLDGFDLGVGVLSVFRKDPHDRRLMINAIGPVWDGNEVWLITGGGALFAAFPIVYATVFSGFYLALMLLLFALMARAISMEFRGKVESATWKRFWDYAFGIGSLLPALLFGVAVGNILKGVPIDATGTYTGTFLGLLNPYAVVVGLLSLVMFTCHGALYMTLKSDGELREAMKAWASRGWVAWVALYVVASLLSFFFAPHLFTNVLGNPLAWIFFPLVLAGLVYLPVGIKAGNLGRAFLASSVAILSLIGLCAVSLFPRLVPSSIDLAFSLTAGNASSTPRTLTTMLWIAILGMPLVLVYSFFLYRTFRGKVVLTEDSY